MRLLLCSTTILAGNRFFNYPLKLGNLRNIHQLAKQEKVATFDDFVGYALIGALSKLLTTFGSFSLLYASLISLIFALTLACFVLSFKGIPPAAFGKAKPPLFCYCADLLSRLAPRWSTGLECCSWGRMVPAGTGASSKSGLYPSSTFSSSLS